MTQAHHLARCDAQLVGCLIVGALLASCAASRGSALAMPSAGTSSVRGSEPPPSTESDGHGEHAGHGPGTQVLGLFVGGVDEVRGEAGFAGGVDYEYLIDSTWGVGGFAEGVSSAERSFVLGAQVYYHGLGDLVLVTGGGVERRRDEWEPILRVGGFYELAEVEEFVISPSFYYDFTPNHGVLVGGLTISRSW